MDQAVQGPYFAVQTVQHMVMVCVFLVPTSILVLFDALWLSLCLLLLPLGVEGDREAVWGVGAA